MTTYEYGEIVLIAFPQTDSAAKKKRPALVVLDIGDADLVLAPITTRNHSGPGLLKPSWIRLAKVACLEKRGISRFLGRLVADEGRRVAEHWNGLYTLR